MKKFLTLLVVFCLLHGAAHGASRKPNILIFLADDSGWGDYSFSGNTNLHTPNIDSIARSGASLDRFYVCPVCALTRAEFDAIKASQPKAWWTEFARRYPGQSQVLAFSPIAFTRDSTVALMEFVFGCGDSCGGGHLVWLERGAGDRWMIRRVYPIWLN